MQVRYLLSLTHGLHLVYNLLLAMVAIVIMLVLVHKRVRLSRYRELREYYEEQIRYAIISCAYS